LSRRKWDFRRLSIFPADLPRDRTTATIRVVSFAELPEYLEFIPTAQQKNRIPPLVFTPLRPTETLRSIETTELDRIVKMSIWKDSGNRGDRRKSVWRQGCRGKGE
jgi:hypothetical protein